MKRDEELYAAMKAAYEHHMLDVVGNLKFLNHPQSPVYNPWDNVGPLLALILISLFIMMIDKLLWGTLSFLVSALIYIFAVRRWIAWRLHRRLVGLALRDLPTFKALWKLNGVSLVWAGYPPDFCHAPKGDWMKFAERHAKPMELPGFEGGSEGGEGDGDGLGMSPREERRNA